MESLITLNVFGREIKITPRSCVVTIEKLTDSDRWGNKNDSVKLVCVGQSRSVCEVPIHTVKDFGKTPDDFIRRFNELNYKANKKDSK